MAAIIAIASSARVLSTARTPVVLRATTTTMKVESWYDNGIRINLPAGMSASVASASPMLVKKALAYEADIAKMQARFEAFPKKEGTMVGVFTAAHQSRA